MISGTPFQMPDAVTVLVSTELLALLEGDWSVPCQIQIVRTPGIGSGAWHMFQIPERDTAEEWDGHTAADAANRLEQLLRSEA